MNLKTVKVEKPDDTNFILGQTHFIKSVEDIHEALRMTGRRPQLGHGKRLVSGWASSRLRFLADTAPCSHDLGNWP
jgi:adenosine/AMP kinase